MLQLCYATLVININLQAQNICISFVQCRPDICTMLYQHLWRWFNIVQMLYKCFVFTVNWRRISNIYKAKGVISGNVIAGRQKLQAVVFLFVCRADKTEVLTDELVQLEKRIEQIQKVCHSSQKRIQGCLISQGTDNEKRLVSDFVVPSTICLFSFATGLSAGLIILTWYCKVKLQSLAVKLQS